MPLMQKERSLEAKARVKEEMSCRWRKTWLVSLGYFDPKKKKNDPKWPPNHFTGGLWLDGENHQSPVENSGRMSSLVTPPTHE